jgi:hypothetical protein
LDSISYADLEKQADQANLNSVEKQKKRYGGAPEHLKNNESFAFGTKSGLDLRNPDGTFKQPASTLGSLLGHSDNLKGELYLRIAQKYAAVGNPLTKRKSLKNSVNHTNASTLRSKSVMVKQALYGINQQLDTLRNRHGGSPSSLLDIEKERSKLDKVTKLPPIDQMNLLEPLFNQTIDLGQLS